MPHRVADFFRSSNDGIAALKSTVISRSRQAIGERRSSSSTTSTIDEHDCGSTTNSTNGNIAISRPTRARDNRKMHHYDMECLWMHCHPKMPLGLSWPFGRNGGAGGSGIGSGKGGTGLDWKIESPPIMFHDDPDHSSGAIFSGQLLLDVQEDSLELERFEATLKVHVTQKRPFATHCLDCANQYTELKRWNFLTHPVVLPRGTHQFPFSLLLEGHLPASMETPLISIAYEFSAEAVVASQPQQQQPRQDATAEPRSSNGSLVSKPRHLKFERAIEVKRSLPESDLPHSSVRVFPPTNIKAGAHYCQVVHPGARNTLSMRLDGLAQSRPLDSTVEFWKLKKVTWRLEEHVRTIAPACAKHTPDGGTSPSAAAGGAKKGVERVEKHVLGEESRTGGWKADYSPTAGGDGHVEFEFDFFLSKTQHHGGGRHGPGGGGGSAPLRYAGDSRSRDGTQVTHNLMVELVVSREWAPASRPELCTQTGTGRILRMHYLVVVTEKGGLSISWDNECPPVYQDVPPSPPGYPVEVVAGEPPVDYESLEPLDAEPLEAERNSVEGGRS